MSLETYDMGNASDAYKLGVEEGAERERAKIVAWLLNEQREYPRTAYAGFAAMIAEEIEAKEHL